jgi:Zn-dependent protease
MDTILGFLLKVALLAPPILLALTVHEAAHAFVANKRGDPTARLMGRMTLNPFKHLDPFGTLAFFVTALAGSGIGWAKPVPVDYRNLKTPLQDGMLISAAGPASNILLAILLALLFNGLVHMGLFSAEHWGYTLEYVVYFLNSAVILNLTLALFNLIPLPPLDGSGILTGLLSPQAAYKYQQISRYGFLIILALIFLPGWIPGFPNVIRWIVVEPAYWFAGLLLPWLG